MSHSGSAATVVTIQPSMGPDHKLPYPFHINADGTVGRQDHWNGDPARLEGFVDRLDSYDVTLTLADFWAEPQQAVGKYAVLLDSRGQMSTLVAAIEKVTVRGSADEATPDTRQA